MVTKTAAKTFCRNFIWTFRNNVFIDSDLQMYDQSDNLIQNASTPIVITWTRSTSKNSKQLCFIYNEQPECDNNGYNNGWLERSESEGSKAKLQEKMAEFLQDKEHKFHEAAARLQIKISFEAHNFYAADVFFHHSCCIKRSH